MNGKTVAFEDLEKEKVKGFLAWIESEQNVDGFVLEIDDETWLVRAEQLPTCPAEGCETIVPQGGPCLDHAGRSREETGGGEP
jgi:hypothetical protein